MVQRANPFRRGPQRWFLGSFKLSDLLCVSTLIIIVQTNLLGSKWSVLLQCRCSITAAVAEICHDCLNGTLYMNFSMNPEAIIRGANLKFTTKKGKSTAKCGDFTAKSDLMSRIPGCEGTCVMHVPNRKNEPLAERNGHWPALGCLEDLALDIVMQLQTWMLLLWLDVHRGC